jgi:hypothetical protein
MTACVSLLVRPRRSEQILLTSRNPDKLIGTHVFTSMAHGDAGLRQTAVMIDNGTTPKTRSTASDAPRVGRVVAQGNQELVASSARHLRHVNRGAERRR